MKTFCEFVNEMYGNVVPIDIRQRAENVVANKVAEAIRTGRPATIAYKFPDSDPGVKSYVDDPHAPYVYTLTPLGDGSWKQTLARGTTVLGQEQVFSSQDELVHRLTLDLAKAMEQKAKFV